MNKKFIVLEINDPQWNITVENSMRFDFYHTRSYHTLEKENRPVLCVLSFDSDFIAMPFVIRAIPNSVFFDCTSVYGYSGPISNLAFHDIRSEMTLQFHKELLIFFKKNNIIAAFSRLHPLIHNQNILDNFGRINDVNKTVVIDLRLAPEKQKAKYRKSNKYEISQLRKNGIEVVETKSKKDIDSFISIYYETMKRRDASKMYFFDPDYFYFLLDNSCFNAKLLVAKKDDEIIAGAIFTVTNKMMQYHLAGTAFKYIKVAPMKLILDEARLIGNELNLEFLHLGGGTSDKEDDSLFQFKTGFSDNRFQFKTWQLVVDQINYNQLVMENEIGIQSEYFPLYRFKV